MHKSQEYYNFEESNLNYKHQVTYANTKKRIKL